MNHLDLDTLEELRDLLDEGLNEILDEFVLHLDDQKQALDDCLQAGQIEECERIAHTLKGSAGNVGAAALSRAAARIEQLARENQSEQARAELAGLAELAAVSVAELIQRGYLRR
ncbi:MAG: Hpt domain-containing protein [Chromatiaceae bacterium]|nr:Hpt domain-containing protein [Chromatiaceae bacterium]